jgi:K+-sensing histidine kinase KdpD
MKQGRFLTTLLDLLIVFLAILLFLYPDYTELVLHLMYLPLLFQVFRLPGWPAAARISGVGLLNGLFLLYHGEMLAIERSLAGLSFTPEAISDLGEWLGMVVLASMVAVIAAQRRRLLVAEQQATQREAQQARRAEHRAASLATIAETSVLLGSTLELDQVLDRTLERLTRAFKALSCSLILLDEASDRLRVLGIQGPASPELQAGELPLDERTRPMIQALSQAEGPFLVYPDQLNPEQRELAQSLRPGQTPSYYILVPLKAKGKLLGTIALLALEPAPPPQEDLDLLKTLAGQMAAAIEHSHLHRQAVGSVQRLRRFIEGARDVTSGLGLEQVLRRTVERAVEQTDSDLGCVALRQDGGVRMREWWDRVEWHSEEHRWEPDDCPMQLALRQGRVGDLEAKPEGCCDFVKQLGVRFCVCAPLLSQEGENLGVLQVGRRAGKKRYEAEAVETVEMFARQASVAVQNARLYESTQQRARELASLNALSFAINSTLELRQVLERAQEELMRLVGVEATEVWLAQAPGGELLRVSYRGPFEHGLTDREHLPPGEGIPGAVARTGQATVVPNAAEDPRLQGQGAVQEGLVFFACFPLRVREETIGSLCLGSRQPRKLAPTEMEVLHAIANQVAMALENARLYERQAQHLVALESLWQHSLAISSELSFEELLKAIARSAKALTGARYGAVALLGEGGQQTHFVTAGWAGAETCELQVKGHGLLGVPVHEGEALRIREMSQDPRRVGFPPGHPPMTSLLAVPLLERGQAIGRLYVTDKVGAEEFSAEDEGILQVFAAQAAIAIDNARLFQKVGEVEALRELNRLKSEFVSNVSHELRTPLTYLVGYGELLAQRRFPPEKVQAIAQDIHQESLRLKQIIDDLLDISRLESGKYVLDRRPTALAEIIEEQVRHFSSVSTKHKIVATVPPDLPPAYIDAVRIGQVLANLLANAINYSPDGGTIQVTAQEREGEIQVSVSDQGIGIPKDQLGRVFERFYRVDSDLARRVPGTGLGLSVVRLLVEAHGGTVWAESQVGQGSTFYFTVPVANEDK